MSEREKETAYSAPQLRIRQRERAAQLFRLPPGGVIHALQLGMPRRRAELAAGHGGLDRLALVARPRLQHLLELRQQLALPPDALPLAQLPLLLLSAQHQRRDVARAGVAELQAEVVRRQRRAERLARVAERHLRLREVVVRLHVGLVELDGRQAVRDDRVPCLQLDAGKGPVGVELGVRRVNGYALTGGDTKRKLYKHPRLSSALWLLIHTYTPPLRPYTFYALFFVL